MKIAYLCPKCNSPLEIDVEDCLPKLWRFEFDGEGVIGVVSRSEQEAKKAALIFAYMESREDFDDKHIQEVLNTLRLVHDQPVGNTTHVVRFDGGTLL